MSVTANGRSILHKGHGQNQLALAPDVCNTPGPVGPVPIPYPNMSADSNLTDGATTVTIGGNPMANTGAKLSRSSGDEAGTLGGLVSALNMGAFGWPVGSVDVQAEGKGVVRMMDSSLTNGNTYNDTGVNLGETGLGYGDDAECPRTDCKLGRVIEKHRVPETEQMAGAASKLVDIMTSGSKGALGRSAGRMVGAGLCQCGQIWQAASGGSMPASHALTKEPGYCDAVAPMEGFMGSVVRLNPEWGCVAIKILSNAKGHTIVAMSEKWVGKEKDGTRMSKTYSKQKFTFPVPLPKDTVWERALSDVTDVAGASEEPIPSGGSVPSCGKCKMLLPAAVCDMTPCS